MKLKVCGMRDTGNINQLTGLSVDYMGFIFYEKSPRFFDGVIPELPKSIKKVGVFVNETLETIIETINKHRLQAIQLHGDETPDFCKIISERHAARVSASHKIDIIKVFSIKDEFDFSTLEPYENVCDYYLFDTKGKERGGNGYTFDWKVLQAYPSTKPYFLSGGIGLEEVDKVVSFMQQPESKYCYALDVNSKFEIEAGLKNIEDLKRFKTKILF